MLSPIFWIAFLLIFLMLGLFSWAVQKITEKGVRRRLRSLQPVRVFLQVKVTVPRREAEGTSFLDNPLPSILKQTA